MFKKQKKINKIIKKNLLISCLEKTIVVIIFYFQSTRLKILKNSLTKALNILSICF